MKSVLICALTITYAAMAASAPSDVRVFPLLTTTWGQTTVGGNACFNYYTPDSTGYPPTTPGSAGNYPSGCVATGMAQVVNYHQWALPQYPYGTTFTISADGTPYSASIMGGTLGGNYDWSIMPNISTSLASRQEAGRLLHDLGAALSMQYYSWANWGSATDFDYIDNVFMNFNYSNAVTLEGNMLVGGTLVASSIPAALAEPAITTNLDAGLPVLIGVNDNLLQSGHVLVIDGYGVDSSGTTWFHWNFGMPVQGVTPPATNLGWFTLPGVGTTNDSAGYTVLDGIAMNIFHTNPPVLYPTGEIISGRIIDMTGNPVSGARVDITGPGVPITVYTNAEGIFASYGTIASNASYLVAVSAASYTPHNIPVNTGITLKTWSGTSTNGSYINTVGNRRVDLTLQSGICDLAEFAGFSQHWNTWHTQTSNPANRYDYNGDWNVDAADLTRLVTAWLATPVPFRTEMMIPFGATGSMPANYPWQYAGSGGAWSVVSFPMVAAESPAITHNQSTSFNLPVKLYPGTTGNIDIMFTLECDTEMNADVFEFLVDGVVQTEMGGFSAFSGMIMNQPMNYQLTGITAPTLKTLQWRYTKDAANSSGADKVWIGNIDVIAQP